MSAFIASMFAAGLMLIPPVSKVIPLPTSARSYPSPPRPRYASRISFGGCALPFATERSEPMPFASMSARSSTSLSSPASAAIASARSRKHRRCQVVRRFVRQVAGGIRCFRHDDARAAAASAIGGTFAGVVLDEHQPDPVRCGHRWCPCASGSGSSPTAHPRRSPARRPRVQPADARPVGDRRDRLDPRAAQRAHEVRRKVAHRVDVEVLLLCPGRRPQRAARAASRTCAPSSPRRPCRGCRPGRSAAKSRHRGPRRPRPLRPRARYSFEQIDDDGVCFSLRDVPARDTNFHACSSRRMVC